MLAFSEAKFNLGDATLVEIDPERHQCNTIAVDLPHQFVHLAFMQKQLPRTAGFMLQMGARLLIFRDIGVKEVKRAVLRSGEGFLNAGLTRTKCFHLGTCQHNPGLHRIGDEVIMPGLAVQGDITLRLGAFGGFIGHANCLPDRWLANKVTRQKLSVNSILMSCSALKSVLLTVFAFIAFLSIPASVHAANIEVQNYKRAFALVESGHAEQAVIFALKGRDPVLNKALRAYYMAQPGSNASFNEITSSWAAQNPEWPGQRALAAGGQSKKVPADAASGKSSTGLPEAPADIIDRLLPQIHRCLARGRGPHRTRRPDDLITDRWVEGEFTGEEQSAFLGRFSRFIDNDTHWSRLDHLLWKGDAGAAKRMYSYVDDEHKMIAEARLALAGQKRNARDPFALPDVPAEGQDDPGLLHERLLRYYHSQ